MKNTFEAIYEKHMEIKAQYEEAKKADNAQAMTDARNAHADLTRKVQDGGEQYTMIYGLYEQAMESGNAHIDLSECHEYRDEAAIIAAFREYGIEAFTFSSTWSGAVESAWKFIQNGCSLQGMVQINSRHKDYETGEYEKRAAFLFKVEEV